MYSFIKMQITVNVNKKYCVTEGDTISAPAVPEYKDREFAGWQDDKGYEADFSQPVEQNRNYYAVWK